ncbi:MAG: CoB--CoM heterodisulfide reductase iron-sulfur subunit B family protein [Anaerolineae bacterium]|nr:CoB--CoM heterodisulfide reductase iron-sulfur subunit B family protein [Anaerolineae bacterium]
MTRRYALYLGCSVPVRGMNYEMSARRVAERLDIELTDIDGFSCCGFPAKPVDWEAGLLMAARNLALAEAQGLDIMTLCSACTGTLTEANHRLRQDGKLLAWANRELAAMGHLDVAGSPEPYRGTVRVRHFARVLYEEVGVEVLREKVTESADGEQRLAGFGFAPHYGCHYLKPSHVYDGFDDPENPQSLDRLIEATGARVVRYEDEGQCCGGGILGFDEETALLMTGQKLGHITEAGADAMVLICPFCAIMYEANQRRAAKLHGITYDLPVLYYPQILGLAMGFSMEEMGVKLNRVKPRELIKRLRET